MPDVLEELRTGIAEKVHYCGLATLSLNEVIAEIRDFAADHPGLTDETEPCADCGKPTFYRGYGAARTVSVPSPNMGMMNAVVPLCPDCAEGE